MRICSPLLRTAFGDRGSRHLLFGIICLYADNQNEIDRLDNCSNNHYTANYLKEYLENIFPYLQYITIVRNGIPVPRSEFFPSGKKVYAYYVSGNVFRRASARTGTTFCREGVHKCKSADYASDACRLPAYASVPSFSFEY